MPEGPAPARVERVLKDGYWDRTEVVELDDGTRRVRKFSKGAAAGPWGVQTLRAEIHYLRTLPPAVQGWFPDVLNAWVESESLGYEMPFYENLRDAAAQILDGSLQQKQADKLQEELAKVVFRHLHVPAPAAPPVAAHVEKTIREALAELEADAELRGLISAEAVQINGQRLPGPGRAFQQLAAQRRVFNTLGAPPAVRLHGDLFLENILYCAEAPAGEKRLVLLDPVSVAGVSAGPALFDLVKYESFATGELFALRNELVDAGPDGNGGWKVRVRWEAPELRPFRMLDLRTRFRGHYRARHGEIERVPYRLLEAYFALVMARNTKGLQRSARVLKAAEALGELAGH